MTALFASADDLAARLGVSFDADDTTRAETLLGLASGLIQACTRQTIGLVTNDVLTRPGTTDNAVRLPERPVVDVSSVILNGVTLVEGADWELTGDRLVRPIALGTIEQALVLVQNGWGDVTQTLQVTYTHGYEPVPDAIRAVCLEATVRVWTNPGSVARERFGSEETEYALRGIGSITGLVLSKDEQAVVRYAVAQPAGSIGLR